MRTTYKKQRTYKKRKQLANPIIDVACVVILTVILMVAGYLHVGMA